MKVANIVAKHALTTTQFGAKVQLHGHVDTSLLYNDSRDRRKFMRQRQRERERETKRERERERETNIGTR